MKLKNIYLDVLHLWICFTIFHLSIVLIGGVLKNSVVSLIDRSRYPVYVLDVR